MQPLHQNINVNFRYSVHFTTDLFAPTNSLLAQTVQGAHPSLLPRLLFVVDEGLYQRHPGLREAIISYGCHYSEQLHLTCPPLFVPGGEAVKNDPVQVARVLAAIHEAGICRHSYVVAVGGGAVLDMAGYAAATAHRGVRLIRVPTTVLSQNDSAVGVKNGVNAFYKKNFLGTFAPPVAVLNDFHFLTTLSDRDWRSGIAEAVKVALIKDADFFAFLEACSTTLADRDMPTMQRLIYRCAELHLRHIGTSGDPFEHGSSRPLDFGHWAAHKLEQLTDYRLRHGEAVAIGIALDTTYSWLAGLLSQSDWMRVLQTLSAVGFTLYEPELLQHLESRDHPRCLLQGLNEFREHLGGQLTIMLLERIGQGVEVHHIEEALVRESIQVLHRLHHAQGATQWSQA